MWWGVIQKQGGGVEGRGPREAAGPRVIPRRGSQAWACSLRHLGRGVRMRVATPEGRQGVWNPCDAEVIKSTRQPAKMCSLKQTYFSPHTQGCHSCSNIYLGLHSEKTYSSDRFRHFPILFSFFKFIWGFPCHLL